MSLKNDRTMTRREWIRGASALTAAAWLPWPLRASQSEVPAIEQLARGLYGALIVRGENEPVFERDWPLLIDDWRLTESGRIDAAFSNLHTQAHGGRMGNFLTINRQSGPWQGQAIGGERVRLRLVNTATNRVLQLAAEFPAAVVLAKDGQPLETPEPVPEVLVLGPGERWDLGWLARDTGRLLEVSGQRPLVVADVKVTPSDQATIPRNPEAMTLPANPMPQASGEVVQTVSLPLEGGAMGQLASARYDGETLSFRELVDHGQVWALSGQVGLPETPLFRARSGETVAIQLDNQTSFPHTLHWHGHHVWADGRWQDSVTLARGQKKTVRMVADGQGKWLIHCHMIDHQATGMMTWFDVV